MFPVRRQSLVRPRCIRSGLCAALALAALGCGREAPAPAREEQVQFAEMRGEVPPPPPSAVPVAHRATASEARSLAADAPPAAAEGADASAAGVAGAAPAGTQAALQAAPQAIAEAAPMLIRTGTAAVEVDSLAVAVAQVRALAARVGGYVANTSLAAGREQVRSATLELRVPAERFDALVGGLAPLGRVERVDVRAEDVGEEFVDVTARVANARRLEARLVELLAARTGRLQDVLAVERELARVRDEIERYEGRLRYLRVHAATSTLAVTVHERPPLLAAAPNASPIADAFRAAGRNFVGLVAAVIAGSGVWAPVGVLAYAAWRWRRRRLAPAA